MLGGAAVRPTPANNEFYLRAKASVGDAEAIIQDENMPGHPDEIVRQTQDFQRDITFHNRRSIHHYCLIGRNLNALKIKKELSSAASLHYSQWHMHDAISYKFVQIIFILYKNKTNNRSNT